MTLIAPGTCRYCGCHGESCSLPDGDRCTLPSAGTVCNAPGCTRAELARVRAARAAAIAARPRNEFKGWGYGAKCIELRKRDRARRRKRRAA